MLTRAPGLQSGLHAEPCEIDRKMQAVIAGRKRAMLQSIQEETGTNIYFPSPLQGLVGPDVPQSAAAPPAIGAPPRQNANVIWITGEFFGVQRARDMLYQVAGQKVSKHYKYNLPAMLMHSCRRRLWSLGIARFYLASWTGWSQIVQRSSRPSCMTMRRSSSFRLWEAPPA